jgi:hypothetical protein
MQEGGWDKGPMNIVKAWVKHTASGFLRAQTEAVAMQLAVKWSGGRASDPENLKAIRSLFNQWDNDQSAWNIMMFMNKQALHEANAWKAMFPGATENGRKMIRALARPVWAMDKILRTIGEMKGYKSNMAFADKIRAIRTQMETKRKAREQAIIAAGKGR